MPWFAIEIIYDGADPGTVEMHRLRNLTGSQLKKFREDVFFAGLYIPTKDKATEGEIISPYRLRRLLVYMQETKFE